MKPRDRLAPALGAAKNLPPRRANATDDEPITAERIEPAKAVRSRQATFRKRDLRVMIETMRQAGLSIARVEVAADGQITVVHGTPASADPASGNGGERHPWDE